MEVIQQGVACHYTPPIGNADLKEVIAKKIERDNHIKVNPQRNIIINHGSDVGLYFAMTQMCIRDRSITGRMSWSDQ